MGNSQSKKVVETPPSAQEFYNMLSTEVAADAEYHPARYLATHAIQKGAQVGTTMGAALGFAMMFRGGRGSFTRWSMIGGVTGAAGGLALCFAKCENPEEQLKMNAAGVRKRCEMLRKNQTENTIDKAGLYGGALGLMSMTGPFRLGGAFVGYGLASSAVRATGPEGQKYVTHFEQEASDWAEVGKKCLGLTPTNANCEDKKEEKSA